MKLAERIGRVEPFYVMEVVRAAQEQEAQWRAAGRSMIHLSVGEPDFTAPPQVVAAGERALREGATGYTLAGGLRPLREAIARHFGVTRATVWNALQDAEALGVRLFSVRGKGYRLPQPVRFIEVERVLAALGERAPTFALDIHDCLPSTNTHLMQMVAAGAQHGVCMVAELQTEGRGRRGRVWQAGLGNSLTFSVLWRFGCGAGALSGLSLAVGVALMRALNELGVDGAGLKWPNDVLHQNRKLAGILIELQGDMDGPSAAVIGIGLNLRLPERLQKTIDQAATDLDSIAPQPVDSSLGLGTVLRHLAEVLEQFERQGFDTLRAEWVARHAHEDRPVRLLMPDGREIDGVARGIAADGALLVATANGLQRFAAGEVSLRGAA
ncbi:bifunctional ligase/repressor BirA [mine drainage metagenome]|uniref:Bifunctional ligase/repressor BirA n=1 Tax=mine drainage metagenome TaxID=410659 RepID=A0A1J5QVS7_9ZZZZ